MDFKITIEQDEDGWYIVTVPALPGLRLPEERPRMRRRKISLKPLSFIFRALARDGIPLYHRPGTKETFVAVDI